MMSKHNIFLPISTDDELISEQGVQSLNRIPLIVLEGSNDVLFFNYMFGEVNLNIKSESKGGWDNVYKFIEKWNNNENISDLRKRHHKVIGIIDKDYHDFSGIRLFPENIIKTDYRDLEVILFESNTALKKILTKYGSASSNYPRKENGELDLDCIRLLIYEKAMILGKIRYQKVINKLDNLGINCITDEGKGFDNFFCYKTFTLDERKLTSLLCQRNREINESIISDWLKIEVSLDPKLLCRGHDIISILAKSFRKHFNNLTAQQVNTQKVEEDLLLAYPFSDFKNLSYAQDIFNQLGIQLSV